MLADHFETGVLVKQADKNCNKIAVVPNLKESIHATIYPTEFARLPGLCSR
jgi:hypothetical protein